MNDEKSLVRIAPHLYQKIVSHARKDLPLEACGLLAGRAEQKWDESVTWTIHECAQASNIALDPARNFEIAPDVLLDFTKRLRETEDSMIGWYHSHPDGTSRPSITDVERIYEDRKIWLIVAEGEVTAWLSHHSGHSKGDRYFSPLCLNLAP